ncbi:MAG: response regulator [Desulfobacterales bacterium]|nr:response regulator [Desulfobacterales bacterium]
MYDRQLKILLVEDDEDDYVMTRDLLAEIEGVRFKLEWEKNWDAALTVMQRNQYDVYLVDYRLGEHNGLELLRKAVQNGCKAPIILLTGQGDREIDIKAMKGGAADYLEKGEIRAPMLERSIRYSIERNRLQSQLKDSEIRLSAIITNTVDALIIMDSNKIIRFVNPAAESLFKQKKEALLNRLFEYPVASGETKELQIGQEPDEIIIAEMRVTEIDWEGENAYLASLRNITERKNAEEQIRLLTHQLLKSQESERQKISKDLHDSVAQDLSVLKIGMDTLFDPWSEIPEEIGRRLSDCSKLLSGLVVEIRNLSYDLCPACLDQLGLKQTISQYCGEFSNITGIKVDFMSGGIDDVRFDSETEINLYRLIQEALLNVKKHADAKHVTIKLVASYPKIILRIEDDGKGFDVAKKMIAARSENCMGLYSMQERVSLLGGKIKIKSRPMQGTKIFIEVDSNATITDAKMPSKNFLMKSDSV